MTEDVEILLDTSIVKKIKEDDEIEEIIQKDPILSEFDNDRFSDIAIFAFGKTWKLHKLMLIQSPMLKEKIGDNSVILLETAGWPKSLDAIGMEMALRSLYHLDTSKFLVSMDLAFKILVAACFLQLYDLAQKCFRLIDTEMSSLQNIVDMPMSIDNLKFVGNYGICSPGQEMLEKFSEKLKKACLGSLLYCVSLCDVQGERVEDIKSVKPTIHQNKISTSQFLSQLPLGWIQLVLGNDALTVNSEFQRYELAKSIFEIRQANPPVSNVNISDLVDVSSDSVIVAKDFIPPPKTKTVGDTLYNFLFSSGKKRKLDDDFFTPLSQINNEQTLKNRVIKPLRNKKEAPTLPTTLSNIYQQGIVYTFMSFEELGYILMFYY
jgi:hypothetical protein